MATIQERLTALSNTITVDRNDMVQALTLSVRAEKPIYKNGETCKVYLRVQNDNTTDSIPVKYSLLLIEPSGKQRELINQNTVAESVTGNNHGSEFELLVSGESAYTWQASDKRGKYSFVFQAKDTADNVIGSSIAYTDYIGSDPNTQMLVTISPSAPIIGLNQTLSMTIRIQNLSGRYLFVRSAFLFVGPTGKQTYAWTPATLTETTGFAAGFDITAPLVIPKQSTWEAYCEVPHIFSESDIRGLYTYGIALYDYSTIPTNPDDWSSQPLLAYATAQVQFVESRHATGLDHFDQVLFKHNEKLDIDDLDKMSRSQIEAGSLLLGSLTGFSDYVTGMNLYLENGYVKARTGWGWQFKELIVANGKWARDDNQSDDPQFTREEYRQYGSWLLFQGDPELTIDSLANHGLGGESIRYDIICAETIAIDEGIEEGSAGDLRMFVDPLHVGPTNHPDMKTETIPTRRKLKTVFHWVTGGSDPYAVYYQPLPAGYTRVGYVVIRSSGVNEVANHPYPPSLLLDHRNSSPIDHQLGSIHARHLAKQLVGDFVEGADLNIHAMSLEIVAARGNYGAPDGIHQRLSQVIDDNGLWKTETLTDAIASVLESLLGDIVDSRGNLLSGSLEKALEGKASLVVAACGEGIGSSPWNQGSLLPTISGFDPDELFLIVSPNYWAFTFGSAESVEGMKFVCKGDMTTRIVDCYCALLANFASGEQKELINNGVFNFLILGVKTLGA